MSKTTSSTTNAIEKHLSTKERIVRDLKKNYKMYLIFIPVFVFFLLFNYLPMVGVLMAFQDYSIRKGIFGSPWVGLDNFINLFSDVQAWYALRNTLCMALLNLTIGYIIPIFFALCLSQVSIKPVRRVMQSISYWPNFVATVVLCTLLTDFLASNGAITQFFVTVFGMEEQNMLAINSPVFWFINLFADTWQGTGYAAIVFVAAIQSVNKDLYEAAAMDGCSRFKCIYKITLPSIWPTILTMFTLKVGTVFKTGFDKVLLIYMPSTYEYADVLTTYVYRYSFVQTDYGLSTAVGLLQSLISTVLLIVSNKLNLMLTKTSLYSGGDL